MLSILSPPLFAYYYSALLDDRIDASGLWHFVTTEYCSLAVTHVLVVAVCGAVGSQQASSCLHFSFCVVLGHRLMRLQTPLHDYLFCHLIDSYLFEYMSAYLMFQISEEVDCTPGDRDKFRCVVRSIWDPAIVCSPEQSKIVSSKPILALLRDVHCHFVKICASFSRNVELHSIKRGRYRKLKGMIIKWSFGLPVTSLNIFQQ